MLVPLRAQLLLDVAVQKVKEAQGRGSLHLPVELLHDDLFHPHHVRHCKAILTDTDQVVGQRHVLLLFRGLNCDVEAAQTHTGQVLWLNLERTRNLHENIFWSTNLLHNILLLKLGYCHKRGD